MPKAEAGTSRKWGAVEQYCDAPDPLSLFVPQLTPRRRTQWAEIDLILAGNPHPPVVYFVRVGRNVKIGTSTNLQKRMADLYLGLEDVLAVVPGGKPVEDAYHQRFGRSHIQAPGRAELFGLDIWLWMYLARCRCDWAEVVGCIAFGLAAITWALPFTYGATPLVFGALVTVTALLTLFARLGWDWQNQNCRSFQNFVRRIRFAGSRRQGGERW